MHDGGLRWQVTALTLLTTLLLQILSNLANDYGDSVKGTDNEKRVGPMRAMQSGEISHREMKSAVIVFAVLSLVSGIWLLDTAFTENLASILVFLLLGLAAIGAAVKYTVGKGAYGYSGLGDLFVFVFFGPVGVFGAYYLNTLSFEPAILLPAAASGMLSAGVLNLNNMRDIDNDLRSGKHTLAARLGYRKARLYQLLLVGGALLLVAVYVGLNYCSYGNLLFLLSIPLFAKDLIAIFKEPDKSRLDPFLKKLALTTFVFTLLFGLGMLLRL